LLAAADAVAQVRRGRSLTDVLQTVPSALRPGVQALSFEVMRRLGAAEAMVGVLASKRPSPPVESLLITALSLLWPQPDPPYADHTLVDQAVAACRRLQAPAAGFVNAVLRRFLRERAALVEQVAGGPKATAEAVWNHPGWWVDRLREDWPTDWRALLERNQTRPPMVLRVNLAATSLDQALADLRAAGITAEPVAGHDAALWLPQPVPVDRLPGFAQGRLSVQDLSAQRAAPLLWGAGLPAGARVLDACAAPGGKTAHLLELAARQSVPIDVLALDSDAQRLARVDVALTRLGLSARTVAGDARDPAAWHDGEGYDAILLDAPCSGSGVVRRHPDIRWLRRPSDIAALARTQAALLDALWPLLKPGGRLLYATCSLFRAEGEQQIEAFLQRLGTDVAKRDVVAPGHLSGLPHNDAQADVPGDQATTGTPGGDGFYYALLHRR